MGGSPFALPSHAVSARLSVSVSSVSVSSLVLGGSGIGDGGAAAVASPVGVAVGDGDGNTRIVKKRNCWSRGADLSIKEVADGPNRPLSGPDDPCFLRSAAFDSRNGCDPWPISQSGSQASGCTDRISNNVQDDTVVDGAVCALSQPFACRRHPAVE